MRSASRTSIMQTRRTSPIRRLGKHKQRSSDYSLHARSDPRLLHRQRTAISSIAKAVFRIRERSLEAAAHPRRWNHVSTRRPILFRRSPGEPEHRRHSARRPVSKLWQCFAPRAVRQGSRHRPRAAECPAGSTGGRERTARQLSGCCCREGQSRQHTSRASGTTHRHNVGHRWWIEAGRPRHCRRPAESPAGNDSANKTIQGRRRVNADRRGLKAQREKVMPKFFIKRPIVAMVIAILMVIVGAVTIATLPIAQFPNIAPPEIRLQATYPGADAKTLEDAVAVPIEQQVNGVDNMSYMYSLNATANQQTSLYADFDVKTDPNTDLLLTQSREQLATGQLPPQVNTYGVTLKKAAHAPLMLIALYSPHGTHDAKYLANYAYINLNDPIARLYGVGQTQVFGSGQYAMRLWVKPDQMAKLGITVTDIADALKAQNTVNPAGQVGGEPAQSNQQFTYAVLAQGRLTSPEQFGDVVVREAPNGGTVRVRDVARVELGTQDYSLMCRLNGKPSAAVAVYQLPGSNAVKTVEGVRKLMAQMKQRFPEDMDYTISLDQTLPVTEGMKEIIETLLIAIVLVILVVYLFLQDWRATLIPMLAVPVSLVGTFVIFPLFGLVLAIGLVVDDAIVVVEGVQHHIEEGLSPRDASIKAMQELSGPVVGIALVLASVFVPTAFIPGITGRLYQQFAITIAISVMLSAFNALTLSPALSALLLKPKKQTRGPLGKFFGWFNAYFERSTDSFVRWSGDLIRKAAVVMVLLVVAGGAAWLFSKHLPTSFLPDEDQGYLYINMQLPKAASMERTSAAAKQVEQVLANTPGVQYTTSVVGFSLLSYVRTSYNAFFWVSLNPWDERKSRSEQYQAIKVHLNQELKKLPDGTVFSFSPPAIPGVGTSGGVTFVLEDRAGKDIKFLTDNLNKFMAAAPKTPWAALGNNNLFPSGPGSVINVDREKVLKQGVNLTDVYNTIQAYMGGLFVNYYNDFGRTWQVYVEEEAPYRTTTNDLAQFFVSNGQGQTVPLTALERFEPRSGPEFTMR